MQAMNKVLTLALAPLLTLGADVEAAPARNGHLPDDPVSGYAKARGGALDAYIAGRLTTAFMLNRHLAPYDLHVDVHDTEVTIGGTVESAVLRDLALEVARGIQEAGAVRSLIRVDPAFTPAAPPARAGLALRFEDASITARVKTRLLWHGSTSGLAIYVDTRQHVVTLTGTVRSTEESALAEQIAANTPGVRRVENRLYVALVRSSAD